MKLGSLSEKYESNGNPGAISKTVGDKGGPSYGLYQLSLTVGSLKLFIINSRFRSEFKELLLGSKEFNEKWQQLARENREAFIDDQHKYHKKAYFDSVRLYADTLNIPDTNAINQVLWSTSTQHGSGWTKRRLATISRLKERDLIKEIYKLRSNQFKNSKYYNSTIQRKRIKHNVLARFKRELREALSLI